MLEVTTVQVKSLRKVLRKYQDDVYQTNADIDRNKLGKILTIIDGAIADETQRKAIKDMVNEVWYRPVETIGKPYPRMEHVTKTLGFSLYDENELLPTPDTVEEYNPYKDLVKE